MGSGFIRANGYTVAYYKDGRVMANFNSTEQLGSYKNGDIYMGYSQIDSVARYSGNSVTNKWPNDETYMSVEFGNVYYGRPSTSHHIGGYQIKSGGEDEAVAAAYVAYQSGSFGFVSGTKDIIAAQGGSYSPQRRPRGRMRPPTPEELRQSKIILLVILIILVVVGIFVYGAYQKHEADAAIAASSRSIERFYGTNGEVDYSGDSLVGAWVCVDPNGLDSFSWVADAVEKRTPTTFNTDGTVSGILCAWHNNGSGVVFCERWTVDADGKYLIQDGVKDYTFVITFEGDTMYVYEESDIEQRYTTWKRA